MKVLAREIVVENSIPAKKLKHITHLIETSYQIFYLGFMCLQILLRMFPKKLQVLYFVTIIERTCFQRAYPSNGIQVH